MPSCDFDSLEASADDVAVEDWYAVGDPVAAIEEHGGHHALGVEGHEGLHSILHSVNLELFEHQLQHSYFVLNGVHDSFSDENRGVFGVIDSDLLEGIAEQYLHIFPILHDTLRSGMAQLQQRSVLGGLVSHHDFLLKRTTTFSCTVSSSDS